MPVIIFLQLVVTFISAHWLGSMVVDKYRLFNSKAMSSVSSMALGLLFLSYLFFALAHLKWIYPVTLQGLFGLMIVVSCFHVKKSFDLSAWRKWTRSIPAIIFAGYILYQIVFCFLPPAIRDEIIYHLEVPRQILNHHGFFLFQDNIYAYFPFLSEWFFMFGLGVSGPAYAKLFHVLSGALLAGALFVSAKEYFQIKKAGWSVLLFISIPSVMVSANWAYVDLTFSLFVFLAFVCAFQYSENPQMNKAVFAGVFLGAAACVKYTGVQCTILMAIYLLLLKLKNPKIRLKDIFCLCVVAALICFPYFIRNYVMTGWPLFPFETLSLPLKPGINWDAERSDLFMRWLQYFGTDVYNETFWDTLLAPVKVFLFGAFNRPSGYEGILGPFFLLIPFLWIARRPKELDLKLLLFVGAFLIYWMLTTKQIRFLFPILPILCILFVRALERLGKGWAPIVLSICFLTHLGLAWPEIQKKNLFMGLNPSQKGEYLKSQHLVYPAYARANEMLSDSDKVYLLGMKNYVYYLDREWRSDFIFERHGVESILKAGGGQIMLEDYFRELRVSHLLLDQHFVFSKQFGLEAPGNRTFYLFLKKRTRVIFRHGSYGLYQLKLSESS